jgi:hypothetical protein
VLQALEPRFSKLDSIEERLNEGDAERVANEARQGVRSKLDELKGTHEKQYGEGSWTTEQTVENEDTPNVEDTVLQLALGYQGQPDAIERGYKDYLKLVGAAENGLLSRKGGEPAPALAGGQPATEPTALKTFDEAKEAAMRRLQADRTA